MKNNNQTTKSREQKAAQGPNKADKAVSPKKENPSKSKKSGVKDQLKPNPQQADKKPDSAKKNIGPKASSTPKSSKATLPLHLFDEIFTWEEAIKVATLDAAKLSSNTSKFVKQNIFQYYIALNMWGQQWVPDRDYNKEVIFRNWLLNRGLVAVIADCAIVADDLVDTVDTEGLVPQLETSNSIGIIGALSGEISIFEGPTNECLNKLRFLKRFTPCAADKLEASTLESFVGILNETNWRVHSASISRDPDVSTPLVGEWGKRVKKYLTRILRNFPKYYAEESGSFSNGVCSDSKTLIEKIAAYSAARPYFDNMLMGINIGVRKYRNNRLYVGPVARDEFAKVDTPRGDDKEFFVPTVTCVPKNYKSYRTIAPESAFVSFEMQRVRKALVKCVERNGFKRYFNVSDQEPNRRLAMSSSIDGKFITVDLSSASDREARHVMRQILPEEVWSIIEPLLPRGIRVGKKVYFPSIFLTSGNPATFMFLGILILAIALAARELHYRYTKEWVVGFQIFGDDGVINAEIAEEFFSFLEHLGLQVNYSKTFMQHYRESCGVEFADGYSLTTDFWPRKTVTDPRVADEADNIASLVALQHRMFWETRCSTFLHNVIRAIYPKMTESEVGSSCTDLWSLYPGVTKVKAPISKDVDDEPTVSKITGDSFRKKLPSDALPPGTLEREIHLTVKQRPNQKWAEVDCNGKEAVDQYNYYRFLAEGPVYQDELSRLLRVSDPKDVALQAMKPVTTLAPKRIS